MKSQIFCYDCNSNFDSIQIFEAHREKGHHDFSKSVDKTHNTSEIQKSSARQQSANRRNANSFTSPVSAVVTNFVQQQPKAVKKEKTTVYKPSTVKKQTITAPPQLQQQQIQLQTPQQVQISTPSPKHTQYEVVNNNVNTPSQDMQPQYIQVQSEDGSLLNMNNLILTENGELIIQNLEGLLPNGQTIEGDDGSHIQISNLEQFLMEQGLSTNAEISYIQSDMISDDHQVIIQNDESINQSAQDSLMQTYKEIFEPDDELIGEQQQSQDILLNGEYIIQSPQQQKQLKNNIQHTIEHIDVTNSQAVDAANQSTLDELGDILVHFFPLMFVNDY